MDAKEKLAALKAGKRITKSDGKTTHSFRQGKTTVTKSGAGKGGSDTHTTTGKSGWGITTGVQKKTIHTPSPKSTAGKNISYKSRSTGGVTNVMDLGHNPTKKTQSKATTILRKAAKSTKPEATKHSTAKVPTVKVPQVGAPTVPTTAKPKSDGPGLGTAAVIAGTAAVAGLGVSKLLKGAKAPKAPEAPKAPKTARVNLPKPQLGLPGGKAGSASVQYNPPKNLPAPPKGLPGPEKKVTRRQVVDDLARRSAPKVTTVPKVKIPTTSKTPTKVPTLTERHDARRAKQGAALKNAFEATERADAKLPRASGAPTVRAGGVAIEAETIVAQRPKQIIKSSMDAEGKRTTQVLRGENMENLLDAADKRVGEERRQGGRRDQSTRPNKPNALGGPKQSSRRKAGQRRAQKPPPNTPNIQPPGGDGPDKSGQKVPKGPPPPPPTQVAVKPTIPKLVNPMLPGAPPKAPSAAGFGATEAEITKVATSGQTTKPPTAEQTLANTKAVSEAPKEVRDMVSDIEKGKVPASHQANIDANKVAEVKAPKVGRFATHPQMGGLAADQKVKAPLKGVTYDASKVDVVPAEAHGPEAPKVKAPKVGSILSPPTDAASLDAAYANQAQAAADKAVDEPKQDPKLKKALDKERAKNAKLIAAQPADQALADAELKKAQTKVASVEAPAEPMRGTTSAEATAAAGDLRGVGEATPPMSAEAVARGKKQTNERTFRRNQGQARKAAKDAKIAETGIATIPTENEPKMGAEEAEVRVKKIERDLLDATVAEEGPGKKGKAVPAVGATDSRTAEQRVGKEAVESKVRRVDPGPRDLESQTMRVKGRPSEATVGDVTDHTGGEQRGTIGDLIEQDQDARDARDEDIRRGADKARKIAASRNATPEQNAALDAKIEAEYDRSIEKYFDDTDAHNQRGPRKADAAPRIMDSMIDADADLAKARGAAMPPAPADRTTLDQKIKMVQERKSAGGDAIYNPKETLDMLENLRDKGTATVKPPKSSAAIPPVADLVTEQGTGQRGARERGAEAGRAAGGLGEGKGAGGKPTVPKMGPRVVMTNTGEAKLLTGKEAGTPPAEPPVERGVVQGPPKTIAQLWTTRMADWGRSAYAAQVKRLTSDFLDVAGEKAKATGDAEARVKASKMAKVGKVGGTLGVAALAFAGLGAGEAYAKEHDPEKKVGAAGEQFKADIPEVTKGILKFTAADYGVTKLIPEAVKKVGMALTANATKSAFAAGLTKAAGRLALGAYIGYHAIPFTGKKLAELAWSAKGAKEAGGAATEERNKSQAKYGTVELATKTRHAKEAAKRKAAADAKKGKK